MDAKPTVKVFGNFFRRIFRRVVARASLLHSLHFLDQESADSNLTVTPTEYLVCRVSDQR